MPRSRRIDRLPGCPFNPGQPVEFLFEGQPMSGMSGESLACALLANGVKVFGRSIKYHRPRGPTCLHGHCSGCLVRVDGVPNVRACQTPCRAGQVVERQTGWPGAGKDLFRMIDWVYGQRLDHHGMFTAAGTLNRLALPFVRRMSGFGELPTAEPPDIEPVIPERVPAVVVGAGVAGLAAALEMADAGVDVVLLEAESRAGGRLLDATCQLQTEADGPVVSGWQALPDLLARVENQARIRLLLDLPVVAVYPAGDDLQVLACGPDGCRLFLPQRLVLATGAYAGREMFPNNDLPGVFGPRAADRLLLGSGVLPGEPVVLAGSSGRLLRLALALCEAGVQVAALVGQPENEELNARLHQAQVPVIADRRIVSVRGGRWIKAVGLGREPEGPAGLGLDCGLLVVEAPEAPAYELAHHAGCRVRFDSGSGYVIATDGDGRCSDERLFAAGHCAGAPDESGAHQAGRAAGAACARSLAEKAPSQATTG